MFLLFIGSDPVLTVMSLLRPLSRLVLRASSNIRKIPVRTNLTYDTGTSYEGDGKTALTVLQRDVDDHLIISAFSTHGFRLNSGLFVVGPAAVFPRTILSWDVEGPWDVSPESLSLFWLVEPKPDILVIGVGDKGNFISDECRIFLKEKKIAVEMLETGEACAVFNWLNADRRNVAAALIPNQTMYLHTIAESMDSLALKGELLNLWGSHDDRLEYDRDQRVRELYRWCDELEAGTNKAMNQVIEEDRIEMEARGLIGPKRRFKPPIIDTAKQEPDLPVKKSDTDQDQEKKKE